MIMYNFLGRSWTAPQLVPGSDVWPGVGTGFLTPTPVFDAGRILLFGGVRDSEGVSRVCRIELDSESLMPVSRSIRPVLDVGAQGSFDQHGVILGDVVKLGHDLIMAYIGFSRFPTVKFVAATGVAVASTESQDVFERAALMPLALTSGFRRRQFEALHCIKPHSSGLDFLCSIGDSWEHINGQVFPRYSSYVGSGASLCDFTVSESPLLPQPPNIYRLGRPRWVPESLATKTIVATGGERSGDYRPYVFEQGPNGDYQPSAETFPVWPGDHDWCATQVSYPAFLTHNDQAWVFFNGDNMGRAGCFVMQSL